MLIREHTNATVFSKAMTLVEFEQSGNPQEKYKSGRGFLALYLSESYRDNRYRSYMERVLTETQDRFEALAAEVDCYSRATFTVSLEHRDPVAYRRMRLLEALEEAD